MVTSVEWERNVDHTVHGLTQKVCCLRGSSRATHLRASQKREPPRSFTQLMPCPRAMDPAARSGVSKNIWIGHLIRGSAKRQNVPVLHFSL